MKNQNFRLLVGLLTGLVGLIAMIRLVGGAFDGAISVFAWVFIALAMIPWVGYSGLRARHGHLTGRAGAFVGGLIVLGLALVWVQTFGSVLALFCSLTGFALIWFHDLPPRQPRESFFVRMDELAREERVDTQPARG